MTELIIDPSVLAGVCVICGAPVADPPGQDAVWPPLPPDMVEPIAVRMCDDCHADFEDWQARQGDDA